MSFTKEAASESLPVSSAASFMALDKSGGRLSAEWASLAMT